MTQPLRYDSRKVHCRKCQRTCVSLISRERGLCGVCDVHYYDWRTKA